MLGEERALVDPRRSLTVSDRNMQYTKSCSINQLLQASALKRKDELGSLIPNLRVLDIVKMWHSIRRDLEVRSLHSDSGTNTTPSLQNLRRRIGGVAGCRLVVMLGVSMEVGCVRERGKGPASELNGGECQVEVSLD